jgi:uncharacterized RDD family membrane protein YckC
LSNEVTPDSKLLPASTIAETYSRFIVARRWLGCWVDMAAMAMLFLVIDSALGEEHYRKSQLIWFALVLAYFVFTEWLFGRTLGKLITGTVVVNAQGCKPSLNQVLIRTIFRLVEANPLLLGGILAGIAASVSKERQRLGDMAANTYVIKSRDASKSAG